jgi:hypothetical protein
MVAHPTLLRGAGAASRSAGPLILKRVDDDVVGALLDELRDHGGLTAVMSTRTLPSQAGGALTLFQPVHRVFQVALVEATCDRVGMPRLDPAKIDSAGMVLRRRSTDAAGRATPDQLEGWMQEAPTPTSRVAGTSQRRQVRGWLPFSGRVNGARSDLDLDPDPARRVGSLGTGRPELDLRLLVARGTSAALRERVIPLFPAPPEVGAASGKTLLYGLIPLAGGEQSELPDEPASFNRDDLAAHLPQILRGGLAASIPKPGDFVAWSETKTDVVPDPIALFVTQLRQVAIEMDAFGTSAEARALFSALDAINLTFFDESVWPPGTTMAAFIDMATRQAAAAIGGVPAEFQGLVHRSAAVFLRDAARVLLEGDDQGASVRMPITWPVISSQQAGRIVDAAQQSMRARLKSLVPRTPQFGDTTREYRLRAFVRVRDDDGCPPSLVWSDYSEPFTIAPWYAPSDAAPAVIPLPDAMDRNALKQLKPNVAFTVPKQLADFLNGNKPKDLVSGGGSNGSGGINLDWICSFSIPIITLCAFIVLNIFLSLFDLIFRWLMFIKICIPIPRRSS